MLVSVGVPASHSCPHSATKIWNGLYRLWGGGLHTSFGGEDPSKIETTGKRYLHHNVSLSLSPSFAPEIDLFAPSGSLFCCSSVSIFPILLSRNTAAQSSLSSSSSPDHRPVYVSGSHCKKSLHHPPLDLGNNPQEPQEKNTRTRATLFDVTVRHNHDSCG